MEYSRLEISLILLEAESSARSLLQEALECADLEVRVERLIRLLTHWNRDVRLKAVKALGDLRNAKAIPSLIDRLHDCYIIIQLAAILALGRIGGPLAIESLASVLKDENESIRLIAVESLGRAGSERILPLLREALQDPN